MLTSEVLLPDTNYLMVVLKQFLKILVFVASSGSIVKRSIEYLREWRMLEEHSLVKRP